MKLTIVVALLALVEYLIFTGLTGRARATYGVPAPAVSGHPVFERYLRVQQNTVEQLIVFLPAALAFAYFVHDLAAAILGAIFVVGRALYFRGYVAEPKRRALGMLMSLLINVALVLGALIGVVVSLF